MSKNTEKNDLAEIAKQLKRIADALERRNREPEPVIPWPSRSPYRVPMRPYYDDPGYMYNPGRITCEATDRTGRVTTNG